MNKRLAKKLFPPEFPSSRRKLSVLRGKSKRSFKRHPIRYEQSVVEVYVLDGIRPEDYIG